LNIGERWKCEPVSAGSVNRKDGSVDCAGIMFDVDTPSKFRRRRTWIPSWNELNDTDSDVRCDGCIISVTDLKTVLNHSQFDFSLSEDDSDESKMKQTFF
jgi:hypothetical protein